MPHQGRGIGAAPKALRARRQIVPQAGLRRHGTGIVGFAGRVQHAFHVADQGPLHGMKHGGKDRGLVPETDLALGRMHVDVHHVGRHVHKEHHLRIVPAGDAPLVGLAHGSQQAFVADAAAVDVQQDAVPALLAHRRQGRQPPGPDAVAFGIERPQGLHHQTRPQQGQAVAQALPGQKAQGLAFPGPEREAHVAAGQRQTHQPVLGPFELRGRGLQKLEPCGYIGEQIAHFHDGAPMQGRRLHRQQAAEFHHDAAGLRPAVGSGHGGFHAEAGHRGDARQGLATEAVGRDMLKIVHAGDLAGGVTGHGQFQFAGGDARAVVLHADAALAAVLQKHVHARGAGIQAVFHQFLDHTGRALHHLAGGDLIAQLRR